MAKITKWIFIAWLAIGICWWNAWFPGIFFLPYATLALMIALATEIAKRVWQGN